MHHQSFDEFLARVESMSNWLKNYHFSPNRFFCLPSKRIDKIAELPPAPCVYFVIADCLLYIGGTGSLKNRWNSSEKRETVHNHLPKLLEYQRVTGHDIYVSWLEVPRPLLSKGFFQELEPILIEVMNPIANSEYSDYFCRYFENKYCPEIVRVYHPHTIRERVQNRVTSDYHYLTRTYSASCLPLEFALTCSNHTITPDFVSSCVDWFVLWLKSNTPTQIECQLNIQWRVEKKKFKQPTIRYDVELKFHNQAIVLTDIEERLKKRGVKDFRHNGSVTKKLYAKFIDAYDHQLQAITLSSTEISLLRDKASDCLEANSKHG